MKNPNPTGKKEYEFKSYGCVWKKDDTIQ